MKTKINIKKYIVSGHDKTNTDDKKREDDYIVKSIGAFGVWQLTACIFSSISRFIAMWNLMSVLFLTPNTDFACIKFKDNVTIDVMNSTCYDNCVEYQYYQDVFEDTLISEFDLICDRAWLASFMQMAMMFGVMIGVSVFGWISDRFGRRKALILSGFIDVVFMFAVPFSPNYWTFTCLRFFVGFASGGVMSITTVFNLEIVGPQYREVAGSISLSPDSIAQASLVLFAYLSPTWRIYLLGYGGFSAVILMTLLCLPETPRWLIANGKLDKAVDVMTKAAKYNKRSIIGINDNVTKMIAELKVNDNDISTFTYLDLFRNREFATITLSSVIIWFVAGLCYYGINQYISFLASNIFIVVLTLGLVQIPTPLITILLMKVFGRRVSTIAMLLTIGVTMVLLVFISVHTWLSSIIGIVGASASSIAFSVIYIYVTELYPTPIRNMGFSLSSAGSKLGAMLAPFVANIKPYWIASLIFAVLPFIAVGFCLLLPETKGKKLQDTLDD